MNCDLGHFDEIDYCFNVNENPFIKKLLPMSPGYTTKIYHIPIYLAFKTTYDETVIKYLT
jgi:hypothetical protein